MGQREEGNRRSTVVSLAVWKRIRMLSIGCSLVRVVAEPIAPVTWETQSSGLHRACLLHNESRQLLCCHGQHGPVSVNV